jgi:hypothetical protein
MIAARLELAVIQQLIHVLDLTRALIDGVLDMTKRDLDLGTVRRHR